MKNSSCTLVAALISRICAGELAGQHHLGEAHVLQKLHLFRGAVVGLGAGVQRDGGKSSASAHVLHDQRIGARLVDLVGQAPGLPARGRAAGVLKATKTWAPKR